MAVRVVATGKESEEKIKAAGLTPGKISSSVSTRSKTGNTRTTRTYNPEGEVTRTEVEDFDNNVRTVTVRKSSGGGKPELLAVSDNVRGQSRYVTDFERLAYTGSEERQTVDVSQRTSGIVRSGGYHDFSTGQYVTRSDNNVLRDGSPRGVYTIRHGFINTSSVNSKVPDSTVSSWTQEKTAWYDVPGQLTRVARTAEFKSTTQERSGLLGQGGQRMLAFGAGVGVGLTYPLFHPKDFVKSQWQLITHPKESFEAMKSEAGVNPYGFGGQVGGAVLLGKGIGKVPKVFRQLTFIGKDKVPAESIVEPQVLSGEQRFPTSRGTPSQLKTEFEIGKYSLTENTGGWHASTRIVRSPAGRTSLKQMLLLQPRSATEGLYVAPSLSTHFLRVSSESSTTKISLIPKNPRPTAHYIETEISLIPKEYHGSLSKMNTYFETPQAKGKATISPEFYLGKGEKEAVLAQGTEFSLIREGNVWDKATGFKQFTVIDGERVPIRRYTTETGLTNKRSTIFEKTSNDFIRTSMETESYREGTSYYSVAEFSSTTSGFVPSSGSRPSMIANPSGGLFSSPTNSFGSSSSSFFAPSTGYYFDYPQSRSPSVISPTASSSYYRPSITSYSSSGTITTPSSSSYFGSSTSITPPVPSSPPTTTNNVRINMDTASPKTSIKPSKGFSWSPKYFASIEATSLGITGKASKGSVVTGLGLRPIKI